MCRVVQPLSRLAQRSLRVHDSCHVPVDLVHDNSLDPLGQRLLSPRAGDGIIWRDGSPANRRGRATRDHVEIRTKLRHFGTVQ